MWTRRGLRGTFLLAWGVLWAVGGASAAAELTVADKAALDKMLYDALKEMHNRAADLYNAGDPNGGYRMFQGGLLMARPLLAYRPEVQQLIDQGMQSADRQASIPQRAKLLHDTIEAVRARLKPPTPAKPAESSKTAGPSPPPASPPMTRPPMPPVPPMEPAGPGLPPPPAPASAAPAAPASADTLWKRLGGEERMAQVVDDLLTLTLEDSAINFSRNSKYKFDKDKTEALKRKMLGYLSDLSNGTVPYSGKGMAEAHQGMNIQGKEFDGFVTTLRFVLEKYKVPAKDVEELLAKVRATRKDIVKE
jgi:hemoglobin